MWLWRIEVIEKKSKIRRMQFEEQKDLNNYLHTLPQNDFKKLNVFDPDNRGMNGIDYFKFYLNSP